MRSKTESSRSRRRNEIRPFLFSLRVIAFPPISLAEDRTQFLRSLPSRDVTRRLFGLRGSDVRPRVPCARFSSPEVGRTTSTVVGGCGEMGRWCQGRKGENRAPFITARASSSERHCSNTHGRDRIRGGKKEKSVPMISCYTNCSVRGGMNRRG